MKKDPECGCGPHCSEKFSWRLAVLIFTPLLVFAGGLYLLDIKDAVLSAAVVALLISIALTFEGLWEIRKENKNDR